MPSRRPAGVRLTTAGYGNIRPRAPEMAKELLGPLTQEELQQRISSVSLGAISPDHRAGHITVSLLPDCSSVSDPLWRHSLAACDFFSRFRSTPPAPSQNK